MLPVVKITAAGSSAVVGASSLAAPRAAAQLVERHPAPKPAPARLDIPPHLGETPPQQHPHGMNQGNGDKALRPGLGQAADQVSPAHARINQDRHRPGLEDGEHQGHEIDARPHQQGQPGPGARPVARKPAGEAVALLVELAKADLPITPLARAVAAQRLDHGDPLWHFAGHVGQPGSDIGCAVVHRRAAEGDSPFSRLGRENRDIPRERLRTYEEAVPSAPPSSATEGTTQTFKSPSISGPR